MSSLSFEQFKAEVEGLEKEYRQYTGCNMAKFFRPPEGAFSDSTLDYCEKLGYKCVFWSFAYADWDNNKQPNAEKSKNKILSTAHNGEVLLLHPNSTTNAKILEDVIRELKQTGFTFETLYHLSEFISDPIIADHTARHHQFRRSADSGSSRDTVHRQNRIPNVHRHCADLFCRSLLQRPKRL